MDHAWLLTVGWPKAFWSSYVVFGLFEAWVWRRDRRAASGENVDKGSLRAVVLVIIAGIFTAFYVANAFDFARIVAWKVEWRALALLLIWGGLALRLWAILTLGAFFRVTVRLQDGYRMITTGPVPDRAQPGLSGQPADPARRGPGARELAFGPGAASGRADRLQLANPGRGRGDDRPIR